jgi:hypothetical protein
MATLGDAAKKLAKYEDYNGRRIEKYLLEN